jgi:hypothetical protein
MTAGIAAKNTPDWRMLIRNGIDTSEANAKYFAETLPKLAEERVSGADRDEMIQASPNGIRAGVGRIHRSAVDFIVKTFFDDATKKDVSGLKPEFRTDRYAMAKKNTTGPSKNNLRVNKTAAQLYDEAMPIVEATQKEMIDLARQIGTSEISRYPLKALRLFGQSLTSFQRTIRNPTRRWCSGTTTPRSNSSTTRARPESLTCPLITNWRSLKPAAPCAHRSTAPPTIPAPPFKNSGVGRFYVTTTDNDKRRYRRTIARLLPTSRRMKAFPDTTGTTK